MTFVTWVVTWVEKDKRLDLELEKVFGAESGEVQQNNSNKRADKLGLTS